MKRLLLTLLSFFLLTTLALAAGTAKVSGPQRVGMWQTVTIAWTSDASGDMDVGEFQIRGGTLSAFHHDPESGVSDLYDVVVNVEWDVKTESSTRTIDFNDALGGQGANLSNSVNGDLVYLIKPWPHPASKFTVVVSNAGNAQSGTIVLWFWVE